jgi:hypothetical protein
MTTCYFQFWIIVYPDEVTKSNIKILREWLTFTYLLIPYILWKKHAVAHLVEALCYKPEGREFDFRRIPWIFHWLNLPGGGFDSASNWNESQGYFLWGKGGRCLRLTDLPPSCTDFLEILGASTSWGLKGYFTSQFIEIEDYKNSEKWWHFSLNWTKWI